MQLFERLMLSIQKKYSSIQTADITSLKTMRRPFAQLMLFIRGKYSTVWMAAAIHLQKTNQMFKRPMVSDGIELSKWLGLSIQNELCSAIRMAMLVQNKHWAFLIQMATFIHSQRKTVPQSKIMCYVITEQLLEWRPPFTTIMME